MPTLNNINLILFQGVIYNSIKNFFVNTKYIAYLTQRNTNILRLIKI